MFQIEKTLVSEDLIEKEFVCNLSSCKGVCCVSGEGGAPLLEDELPILEEILPKVLPYLSEESKQVLENQGAWVKVANEALETPMFPNAGACAYLMPPTSENGGISKCGIEKAYEDGVISWKKPVSCHLYPVRVQDYSEFSAVNYHKWDICNSACSLGASLKVPVYKFVKEALIRRFGEDWYKELEQVATNF